MGPRQIVLVALLVANAGAIETETVPTLSWTISSITLQSTESTSQSESVAEDTIAPVEFLASPDDVPHFLADFFQEQGVRIVLLCACTREESLRAWRALSTAAMWVRAGDAESATPLPIAVHSLSAPSRLGVFTDLRCSAGHRCLKEGMRLQQMNVSVAWLALAGDVAQATVAMERLQGLRVDSDVTFAWPQNAAFLRLVEVYRAHAGAPLTVLPTGRWERNAGLRFRPRDKYIWRHRHMHSVAVRAAELVGSSRSLSTLGPEPLTDEMLLPAEERAHRAELRFNRAMLAFMEDKFNFTVVRVPAHSHEHLVELVATGAVDVSLTALPLSRHLLPRVWFAAPAWRLKAPLMFLQPPPSGITLYLFNPFDISAWLSSALILAIIMVLLRLITWLELRIAPPDPAIAHAALMSDVEDSWSSQLLIVLGSMCDQGAENESTWLSWRLVALVCFLLAILLNTYYSASMVTALLLPPPPTLLSVEDVLGAGFSAGTLRGALGEASTSSLHSSPDPLLGQLYSRVAVTGPLSPETAATRVADGPFAALGDAAALFPALDRALSDENKCALWQLPVLRPAHAMFTTPHGSPLREMIAYGVRLAWERGLARRLEAQLRPKAPFCTTIGARWSATLGATAPAFILLLVGTLLAAVALLVERRIGDAPTTYPVSSVMAVTERSPDSGKPQQTSARVKKSTSSRPNLPWRTYFAPLSQNRHSRNWFSFN